jgi:ATP-binding cassette, subfamily B, bacterial
VTARKTDGAYAIVSWVLTYARHRPVPLFAVVAMMGSSIVLGLLKPWPMVLLIDYGLRSQQMPDWLAGATGYLPGDPRVAMVTMAVLAMILLFFLEWLSGLASAYAAVTLSQQLTYDVAGDLFQKLQQLSLRFHHGRSTGDTIRRVTADCGCVSTILTEALLPVLQAVATLVMMFVVMARIHVELTLLTLVVVPYMAFIFRLYARRMLECGYQEQENEGRIYEVVERTFSAMPAVQAFGREALNEEIFRQTTNRTLAAALSVLSVQLQFKILMGLATAAGTAAVLWFGGRAAMAGDITIGTIVLFLSYLASLYAPLQLLMYSGSIIQGAGGSARRVLDILRAESEVKDAPHASVLTQPRGEISFENVSFAHEPGRPALRDVSARIHSGEVVALVGPTGAGKTTLVSLIPRFFDPTEGRVLLDGRDLRSIQLKSLRSHIALVLQEPFLFPISVAENIAYGRPHASRAEIEAVAKAARAHDFIRRLPEGYDSILSERAANLSGGERQRVSIARALLKDAPILILDEPTSALDAETEAAMAEAMKALVRGRTTFIIAHRLATVKNADRIIVLKDGSIAEIGDHADLVRSGGLYARYARAQLLTTDAES